MPNTPIYGLPFENPSEQPGITLHGGVPPSSPILAEEVEEELQRIDTDVTNLGIQFQDAVVILDAIDTAGLSLSTATMSVPSGYNNLMIMWHGNHNGSGRVSLMARFNGDTGNNYGRQGCYADSNNWTFDNAEVSVGATRVGYIGSALRSGGTIWIENVESGSVPICHGQGMHAITGARVMHQAGGSWSGTPPITSVTIGPLTGSWSNGRLAMYGYL